MKEVIKRRSGRHLRCQSRAARRARLTVPCFPRRSALALAAASLVALLPACREAARALDAGDPLGARTNADQLFGALAARYTQVHRDPKYDAARVRLAQAALIPSRIFGDSSVWTAMPDTAVRTLMVQGATEGGHYTLQARTAVPRPASPGDTRHAVTLARLGSDTYVWDTKVEFALGPATARDVGAAIAALLAAPEGRTASELRAQYESVMPRAATALGQLFSIDSLRSEPLGDGTSSVTLALGLHPDRLEKRYPAFGAYLARYADPLRYRFTLTDRAGTVWFYISSTSKRSASLRYRLANGRLAPFTGAPRAMPDTLVLRVNLSMKVKMFTVGVRNLVVDFVITSREHERAWTLAARHEPEWDLPLITERLLRTPLKRPFEGEGVVFRIGVHDSSGAQSLLVRQSHLTVQESAILRFLGSLSAHAVNDLSARAEVEQDLYLREVFGAMQADTRGWPRLLGFTLPESTNAAAR